MGKNYNLASDYEENTLIDLAAQSQLIVSDKCEIYSINIFYNVGIFSNFWTIFISVFSHSNDYYEVGR